MLILTNPFYRPNQQIDGPHIYFGEIINDLRCNLNLIQPFVKCKINLMMYVTTLKVKFDCRVSSPKKQPGIDL